MMNKVIMIGRIANDLEIKASPSGKSFLHFSLAVQRNYTDNNGERQTDFFSCSAWGKSAEFICSHFQKGNLIGVVGALRENNYTDKEGTKHYSTEILIEEVSFAGEKKKNSDETDGEPGNNYAVNDIGEYDEDEEDEVPPF